MNVLPDLSLRQLEYLVAVADAPTWALAADRVGVSPSALSQGLAELERRIGTRIFETVGRRRIIRPAAQPVLDHARQVVAQTADLVAWSERMRDGAAGRVRVGMIDIAAVVHFPAVVQRFLVEHPDVEFTMTVGPSADLLVQLRGGAIDLAVCIEPASPVPGVSTRFICDEALVLVAPESAVIGEPKTWGPWVTFPAGSHTRALIAEAIRSRGATFNVVAESHQPEVLAQMTALGLGWTVLPAAQASARGVKIGPEITHRHRAGVAADLVDVNVRERSRTFEVSPLRRQLVDGHRRSDVVEVMDRVVEEVTRERFDGEFGAVTATSWALPLITTDGVE